MELKVEPYQQKRFLGRVYVEYSRQMYNKYKHQFPKMRESDIVRKIIDGWESLDRDGRMVIGRVYYRYKMIRWPPKNSFPVLKGDHFSDGGQQSSSHLAIVPRPKQPAPQQQPSRKIETVFCPFRGGYDEDSDFLRNSAVEDDSKIDDSESPPIRTAPKERKAPKKEDQGIQYAAFKRARQQFYMSSTLDNKTVSALILKQWRLEMKRREMREKLVFGPPNFDARLDYMPWKDYKHPEPFW